MKRKNEPSDSYSALYARKHKKKMERERVKDKEWEIERKKDRVRERNEKYRMTEREGKKKCV